MKFVFSRRIIFHWKHWIIQIWHSAQSLPQLSNYQPGQRVSEAAIADIPAFIPWLWISFRDQFHVIFMYNQATTPIESLSHYAHCKAIALKFIRLLVFLPPKSLSNCCWLLQLIPYLLINTQLKGNVQRIDTFHTIPSEINITLCKWVYIFLLSLSPWISYMIQFNSSWNLGIVSSHYCQVERGHLIA